MNYIKHLNATFQMILEDSRLNPTHVSLYMALFQLWNLTRFAEMFYLNRQEAMQLSKIGSITTYHRCMRDLDNWKYIQYFPSHNIYKGSEIRMPIFETTSGQVLYNNETTSGQQLVYNTNINKQIENINKLKLPKNENEVLDFFLKKEWAAIEGKKFFNHYCSINWKLGGKIKITNWHATAENWMLKAKEIKESQQKNEKPQNWDNLKTSKLKDYDQPL